MEITVQNLSRSFKAVKAVKNASFNLKSGKIYGLVGPNGAGKTTLMLMLAGLLKPDTGEILFDHNAYSDNPAKKRALTGWMPDMFGTWGSLTPLEILNLFGQLYGLSEKNAKINATKLLDLVKLNDFSHKKAQVFSRGQKQRLGLARALVHDPKLLILDEPASGMDPTSRIDLRNILRTKAQQGTTILVSSHRLSELEEMVEDVIYMTHGETKDLTENITNYKLVIESSDYTVLENWLNHLNKKFQLRKITPNIFQGIIEIEPTDSVSEIVKSAVEYQVPIEGVNKQKLSIEDNYLKLADSKDN